MTLDRINEYFAFATSALVTGVGVMTVSEKTGAGWPSSGDCFRRPAGDSPPPH